MRLRWLGVLVLATLGAVALPGAARAVTDEPGTSRRLADSTEVIAAAIDLSNAAWDDGAAQVVVLGRNDVFADALAGAALAGTRGPVLFTDGGATAPLARSVATEIGRVLADDGCVVVLGGTGAVSPAAESALGSVAGCVERVAGANRIETAVQVAERVVAAGGDGSTVLLARADSWADSATGSAYAAATGHPVLVTPTTGLDPLVAAFLRDVAPGRIVLLGGTGALSSAVETSATAIAPTTRVAGASRDATAVAVAERLWAAEEPTGVTLVNGFVDAGWAYAIAGAVNAALEGAVELYVNTDEVPTTVTGYLERAEDTFTIVAGPRELISDVVVAEVEGGRGIEAVPGTAPMRYRDQVFDDYDVERGVVYDHALDVAGTNVPLVMDVFTPAGDVVTERPVIVYAHGGGFYLGGTGELEEFFFSEFVERGYVVASISYRLIPGPGCSGGPIDVCITGMTHAREDAQNAVRYLRVNAARFGIDTSRVAIMGHSAGGVIAAHVGFLTEETPDALVQAAISLSGANYLSPVTAGDAPVLLIWGAEDGAIITDWAERTVATARERGAPVWFTELAGIGHNTTRDANDTVVEQSTSFLWWQLDMRGAAS